jgi:hypothetical protein
VPRHVARLVTWLVAPPVVDYSALRRLVVDYFASAARPGASARRAACHAARHTVRRRLLRLAQPRRRLLHLAQDRRRLLHLRRVSGCLGTSRSSSRGSSRRSSSTTPPRAGSSSTTSPTPRVRVPRHVAQLVTRLVVDYFAYTARLVASARHAAHRLSSTTSPTPCDRVPQHVARLVALLVVDYFAYAARPGASARRAACHAAHRRLLRVPRLRLAAMRALLQPCRAP